MQLEELRKVFGSNSKALEILSLFHNQKPVVRQGFYDKEIYKVKEFCQRHNLHIEIAPYKVILADKNQIYSNKGFKARVDDPRTGMFFVYISKDEKKAVSARVYEMQNHHKQLGLILGYPECCAEFFKKHFPERSKLDNDYVVPALVNSKEVRHPFVNNILKRNQDITLLSHFPCSFDCKFSEEIGKKNLKLLEVFDVNLAMHYVKQLKTRERVGNREAEFN